MCAIFERQQNKKNPLAKVGRVVAQAMHGRSKISKRDLSI